jgi:hypothetical protein
METSFETMRSIIQGEIEYDMFLIGTYLLETLLNLHMEILQPFDK